MTLTPSFAGSSGEFPSRQDHPELIISVLLTLLQCQMRGRASITKALLTNPQIRGTKMVPDTTRTGRRAFHAFQRR